MAEQPPFRTGDSILHKPSGETWVCAWADPETGYLSWLGWPPGEARISDFELAKAATDDEHSKWLRDLKGAGRRDVARALRLYGDPDAVEAARPPCLDQVSLDLMIAATAALKIRRTRANVQACAGLQIAFRESMRAFLPADDPRRDTAYPFARPASTHTQET